MSFLKSIKRNISLFLIASIGMVVSACAEIKDAELYGDYISTEKCSGETLSLRSDHSFTHNYEESSYSGTWVIGSTNKVGNITFSPFRRWDGFNAIDIEERIEENYFSTSVHKLIGKKIKIVVSDDFRCYFVKL